MIMALDFDGYSPNTQKKIWKSDNKQYVLVMRSITKRDREGNPL